MKSWWVRFRLNGGLLLALALFAPVPLWAGGSVSVVSQAQWVQVKYVFDGDTFMTRRGQRIRLLGINTPEVAHGDEPGQPMGEAAARALRSKIAGQLVRLAFDRQRKDRYGRTLAQVWSGDGDWINGWLVAEGYAHVYTFSPNIRWTESLLKLEHQAIAGHRGIWRTDRFAVLAADAVSAKHVGQFRVVDGVMGKKLDKHGWVFRFGRLKVSVPRRDRALFDAPPAMAHVGDSVRVRGRIRTSRQGRLYLALHSPQDMEWKP